MYLYSRNNLLCLSFTVAAFFGTRHQSQHSILFCTKF